MTDPYQRRPDEPNWPTEHWPAGQPQWPGPQPYGPQPPDQQPYDQPYGQPPYDRPYGQPPSGYQGDQSDPTQQFGPYPGAAPYPTQQFGPYAGQPYQGSYQGSYDQPTVWMGAGQPPEPPQPPQPPRRSKLLVVLIAVLAAVILAGSGVAAVLLVNRNNSATETVASVTTTAQATTTTPATTTRPTTTTATTTASADFQVGQCATLTPQANDRATIRITDCGSDTSDVLIAKVQSSRCDRPYISFDPGKGKVYCLAMDAQVGACFRLDNLIKRSPCSGNEPRKVLQIFNGSVDGKQCQKVSGSVVSYAYPDPAKTVCLGKVG